MAGNTHSIAENIELKVEKNLEMAPANLAQPVVAPNASAAGQGPDTKDGFDDVTRTLSGKGSVTEKAGDEDVEANPVKTPVDESRLLKGKKLALCFTGMLMSIFLIALDQTILAPALPVIASKFQALEQIAWIASAYFLTQCSFLLLYGQALTVFDRRWTYMIAITLFEIGSLFCAVAPNVNFLIFGRAFAGTGAAGIFTSVLAIIADVTTLEQRPKLMGLFGGVFAVSSVIGPLLGGVFTDHVSWRWCFYINLPIGAITILAVLFILGNQPARAMDPEIEAYTVRKFKRYFRGTYNPAPGSVIFKLGVLDWTGAAIMLALITCLILPLQWGGVKYAWSNPIVIGTFCAFGGLVIIFVLYEWKLAGRTSLLPLHYFKSRTQIGASLEAFCIMLFFLLATYYLPIYYEATKGTTASKAGIEILPFMICATFASAASGAIVSGTGRYWHTLVFGPMLSAIASGLLFTVDEHTSKAKLVGYQVILAFGAGSCFQNTIIAVQADTPDPKDIPQKTALVTFVQLVGGTIGIAIANTVFSTRLRSELAIFAPDAPEIVVSSVEAIRAVASAEMQPAIIHAYAKALQSVFIIGVPASILASCFGALTRNLSVKGKELAAGGA